MYICSMTMINVYVSKLKVNTLLLRNVNDVNDVIDKYQYCQNKTE